MHRILKLILLPIIFTLNSCAMYHYFKIAKVKDASYTISPASTQEFPFEIINNRIVIPVLIQGKTYNFLFDTGASLVIDSEFLNEIEYENVARIKVTDANEKGESLKYVKLSELKLLESSFKDQGAIVMDLSEAVENSCINISGIFGASVMKDLMWQIDFERQAIKLSNSIENFNLDSNQLKIPFYTNFSQSPIIEVNINGNRERLLLDTGSGSTFRFSNTNIESLSKDTILTAYGRHVGVFGTTIDTVFYFPKELEFMSSKGESWKGLVEVRNSLKEGLIGLGFLKDYLVTIDWINQNLYLKQNNFEKPSLCSFGFNIAKSRSNLIVSEVYENSQAYVAGIRVDDIIIEIDDFWFGKASEDRICDFISTDYLKTIDSTIMIKINNKENYISLEKQSFF